MATRYTAVPVKSGSRTFFRVIDKQTRRQIGDGLGYEWRDAKRVRDQLNALDHDREAAARDEAGVQA